MDIIIPLGGKGERFSKKGYSLPKPLIPVGPKEMIRHVIDRLRIGEDDTITILYHEQLDQHNFSGIMCEHYPDNVRLVPIPFQTRGAVETIDYGLRSQSDNDNRKCLLVDCDAFYTHDIVGLAREHDNAVFVFREDDVSQPARFSYVSLEEGSDRITDIAEKSRIGKFANTGAYLFKNKQTLLEHTQRVIEDDFRFCDEFYTSCVIKVMLMSGHIFRAIELPPSSFVSLGTPEQVCSYLSGCHSFLFDLDGTLVDTTEIYVNVWKELLAPYNANADQKFFTEYIHGNNDEMALKMLIPKLDEEERRVISSRKDTLFLEFIDRLKIIEGAVGFMKEVWEKGHFIGIVTNCNRLVAESIIRHCGIGRMIDVLVVGNECERPKPYPDPYEEAKRFLGQENIIVFEDSCSGLLSARGTSPKCIVGINSGGDQDDKLVRYGAHIVADNFNNLSVEKILGHHPDDPLRRLENIILESVSARFSCLDSVRVLPSKLKGGYIADVVRVDLVMATGETIECVAKLQSDTVSNLSDMATKLGLYKRENYFYEAIWDHVRIRAPRYFGTIRDDDMKPLGVLLEYLPSPEFQLGLELETEPLDTTLRIIKTIASHHARFWGKDLISSFPQLAKNNDPAFCPCWGDYVRQHWPSFKQRWCSILTPEQIDIGERIVGSFDNIQQHLSTSPLTLCHGDVKSPNIFFRKNEPYFIDWQYIVAGKGAQDLVFFMIESFSVPHIQKVGNILKEYYYVSLLEEGITGYSRGQYDLDFQAAICYFPLFVAIWFGTTPPEQLIDANFPFFFIQKLFSFMGSYLDQDYIGRIDG